MILLSSLNEKIAKRVFGCIDRFCALLVHYHCTAQMITKKLFTRTVEHHLEQLKKKIDYDTKADLTQETNQHESMGYIF